MYDRTKVYPFSEIRFLSSYDGDKYYECTGKRYIKSAQSPLHLVTLCWRKMWISWEVPHSVFECLIVFSTGKLSIMRTSHTCRIFPSHSHFFLHSVSDCGCPGKYNAICVFLFYFGKLIHPQICFLSPSIIQLSIWLLYRDGISSVVERKDLLRAQLALLSRFSSRKLGPN